MSHNNPPMRLLWSPQVASSAYWETVTLCKLKDIGLPEFLSSTAAGWNARFIVETWFYGEPIEASVGLAIAARHTGGRHVCIVPDERSKVEYLYAMAQMGVLPGPEVVVGEAATAVAQLAGLEFLLVDSRQREFARVLTVARVSPRGAILVCKNACERNFSGDFRWNLVLRQDVHFERSVFMPFGNGVDIAYIAAPPIHSNL